MNLKRKGHTFNGPSVVTKHRMYRGEEEETSSNKATGTGIPPEQLRLFNFVVRSDGDVVEHERFGKGTIVDPNPYPGTSFRRVLFPQKDVGICVFERSLK